MLSLLHFYMNYATFYLGLMLSFAVFIYFALVLLWYKFLVCWQCTKPPTWRICLKPLIFLSCETASYIPHVSRNPNYDEENLMNALFLCVC